MSPGSLQRQAQSTTFVVWNGRIPRRYLYSLAGSLIALGAPLGWLLLRWSEGASPAAELSSQSRLYLYMLAGTTLAFLLFGALLGFLADRLIQANTRLDGLSRTDALTGLSNLRMFRERLATALAQFRRSGRALSLILVDVDQLKSINDAHGHRVGSAALLHTARTLQRCMRTTDEICRVGGDEFAVLCGDTTAEGARVLAERTRHALETEPWSHPVKVTASFGIAEVSPRRRDLFARADRALYAAKLAGRNLVSLAGESGAPSATHPGVPRRGP